MAKKKPQNRAGLNEVAQRAGFSAVTVRQILSNRADRYSEATRDAVYAATRELGYMPNSAARQVREGRFGAIGVLLRVHGGMGDYNILKGAYAVANERGLSVLYAETEVSGIDDPRVAPRMLRELCVDGLVVHHGFDIERQMRDVVERIGIPVVWANADADHDCVRPDDAGGMMTCVEALAKRGHRRIAWVQTVSSAEIKPPNKPHYSVALRRDAFEAGLAAQGLEPIELPIPSKDDEEAIKALRSALTGSGAPTAVIANGTGTANLVLLAAREIDLTVPKDLSVVSISTGQPLDFLGMSLSFVWIPSLAVGRAAVEMLVGKMANPGKRLPAKLVPYEPLMGNTIARPPRG